MDDGRAAKLDLRLAQLRALLVVGRSLAELRRGGPAPEGASTCWGCSGVRRRNTSELFVEQIPRAVRWVEADDEHHFEEDENQVHFWAAGGDDCLLEGADMPEFHLPEEHTGIPEVQAVPEVPVDEEMFLGRLRAVGLADSVTPPAAAPSGREASYARLAAYGFFRAPPPRLA